MRCIIFIFCFFLAFEVLSQNNSDGNFFFILDASGSMWQKTSEDYKITTAKTMMKRLVDQMPDNAQVGLVAYGHRSKTDCNDIEVLSSLQKLDRTALKQKLDAINPVGKTPIANSINETIKILETTKTKATIVLISDGLETCEGDACALVRAAREKGIIITLHVIGLALEEKDLSTLECIAQAGGGQYFPAQNSSELLDALNKSVETPPINGGFLSVKVTLDQKLIDATIKAYPPNKPKEAVTGRTYASGSTNPRLLLLPVGKYKVEVVAIGLSDKPIQIFDNLEITANDTLIKAVDFSQGTFQIKVTRNGQLSDATIGIYPKGSKVTTAQGRSYTNASSNPAKYNVIPGIYDIEIGSVEIRDRPSIRIENQVLDGGAVVELAHDFKSGELLIGAQQGSVLIDAVVTVYSKATGKQVAAGRTYKDDKNNPKSFILEPGYYKVQIKPIPKELSPKELEIEIQAEKQVLQTIKY